MDMEDREEGVAAENRGEEAGTGATLSTARAVKRSSPNFSRSLSPPALPYRRTELEQPLFAASEQTGLDELTKGVQAALALVDDAKEGAELTTIHLLLLQLLHLPPKGDRRRASFRLEAGEEQKVS